MGFFQYRAEGRVTQHVFQAKTGSGKSLTYQVLYLPPALERELTFGRGNKLRFVGELEGVPLQGAWQSAPGKGHYAMLSPRLLSDAGRKVGDEVTLAFNVVSDDVVVVPDDLAAALARQPQLDKKWQALTPGLRRGQLVPLEQARTPATRERRLTALSAARRRPTGCRRSQDAPRLAVGADLREALERLSNSAHRSPVDIA